MDTLEKAMKLNIKESNMEPIRKLLTYSEWERMIDISDEDVDHLLDSATTLSFKVSHGENLEDALRNLDSHELELEKATKAMIVMRCSQTYKMQMTELNKLQQYINANMPSADIRWGLSIGRESKENVHVVLATTY